MGTFDLQLLLTELATFEKAVVLEQTLHAQVVSCNTLHMRKLCLMIFILSGTSNLFSQVKSFELDNPKAILLNQQNLKLLTSEKWRIIRVDTENRGNVTETKAYGSLQYQPNRTFKYRSGEGTWQLIDNKYIKHKLNNQKDEDRFNFGGIYALTSLTDSTIILVKVLTSSNDMSRTIYLESEEKWNSRPINNNPYVFRVEVGQQLLDSISTLSIERLFIEGFNVKNDTILFQTLDSLYQIKMKPKSN